jgi:hypothetical protein
MHVLKISNNTIIHVFRTSNNTVIHDFFYDLQQYSDSCSCLTTMQSFMFWWLTTIQSFMFLWLTTTQFFIYSYDL